MKVTTTFLLLYIIRVGQGQASCGLRCCQQKVVNNTRYILSHESKDHPSSCQDGCVYRIQNGPKEDLYCFAKGAGGYPVQECINCKALPGKFKNFVAFKIFPNQILQRNTVNHVRCQPSCWPNTTEIGKFSDSIDGTKNSCLSADGPPIPKFTSFENKTAHDRTCFHYTGLNNLTKNSCRFKEEDSERGIYHTPDPNCVANPFITYAHYEGEMACMTRYQALNNRNFRNEWMAAFIVVAESKEDIQKSINFARRHNIGVSVINTGHELLDRNAGPGPNTLMIRTTCFTDWVPNLKNPIEDALGKDWTECFNILKTVIENEWPVLLW